MNEQNMFAHKLCAMLDRSSLTPHDIFDSWFFMQKQTPINRSVIEKRMKMPYEVFAYLYFKSAISILPVIPK